SPRWPAGARSPRRSRWRHRSPRPWAARSYPHPASPAGPPPATTARHDRPPRPPAAVRPPTVVRPPIGGRPATGGKSTTGAVVSWVAVHPDRARVATVRGARPAHPPDPKEPRAAYRDDLGAHVPVRPAGHRRRR